MSESLDIDLAWGGFYACASAEDSGYSIIRLLDFNRNAQLDFLEWVSRGGIEIHDIKNTDFGRLKELTEKYRDLPMDFADSCLVYLAEKLNIETIATIDRDFTIYRIDGRKNNIIQALQI